MANPLTGDFEAVLQVSGKTVNRLLASMHQNARANPDTPTFPHVMSMRVGDPNPVQGMKGWIAGQVSTPRIDLIHEVSDRFWLEVSVRARYTPDAGSVPIPEFINGTIRAQYRIESIDPNCKGWEKLAPDYLWIRVMSDTVSFTGTAEDDTSIMAVAQNAIDPATADARITALARHLLSTRFQATPHKVSRRFRRGAMRSLNPGSISCVAVPIGLSGDPSAGSINSVDQDFLGGRDVGIGISKDFILARIQEELDAIKNSFRYKYSFHHKSYVVGAKVLDVLIEWNIGIDSASAQWLGGMPPMMGMTLPGGLVVINMHGSAKTSNPIFNFGINLSQTILVSFDGSTESFSAVPVGNATVNLTGTFAPFVEPTARPKIQGAIANVMKNAGSGMTGGISLADRKTELVKQLQTMDAGAGVDFTNAIFTADGVAILGNIWVSPRKAAVASSGFTAAKDGYSAYESWIPGGRIDSFSWSWKWFNNAGKPGARTIDDRYILRRPQAAGQGQFGLMLGVKNPLPGLDGMGQMCLVVSGVTVHPVTGDLVQVSTKRHCKRFGLDLGIATPDRLFLREYTPGPRDPIGPVAEAAIHEVNSRSTNGQRANTLIVRAGNEWNRETAMALRDGLANSRRRDAGLAVLVLFNDGELMQARPEQLEEFRALAAELEAPLVVNEDVERSWSNALAIQNNDTLEWRLVTPTGGVTWAHSGQLAPRDLATALDDYLFRSPPAGISYFRDGQFEGTLMPSHSFESDIAGYLSRLEDQCPPSPFARLGIETAVTFIKKGSRASEAAIRAMNAQEGTNRIVVIDGANADEAARIREMAGDATVIADPRGEIAQRFGIRSWPASASLSEGGVITSVEGHDHE